MGRREKVAIHAGQTAIGDEGRKWPSGSQSGADLLDGNTLDELDYSVIDVDSVRRQQRPQYCDGMGRIARSAISPRVTVHTVARRTVVRDKAPPDGDFTSLGSIHQIEAGHAVDDRDADATARETFLASAFPDWSRRLVRHLSHRRTLL